MNQTQSVLSSIWYHFQTSLFPRLKEQVGELTTKQKQFIEVVELAQIETHLPYIGRVPGRPTADRSAIARAFVAKVIYHLPTTEVLLDYLDADIKLRRLCGWERKRDVPSASIFSRAFAEFAQSQLAQRVHAAVIDRQLGDQLIGHVSRDSTAIVAREKPQKPIAETSSEPKKRGRPKKGEVRTKTPTRLEKQSSGMSLSEMKADLPTACNVGTKRNSKGYKTSWIGYKLHIDACDGGIPISCLLTSASLHDSQVAIPLAEITNRRITHCYDLMDSAYDAPLIRLHSESLGHVALIDENPRTKERKAEIVAEQKCRRIVGYQLAEDIHDNERSTVERVNGRSVRVKGHTKVMCHLMFGIIVLSIDQLMKATI